MVDPRGIHRLDLDRIRLLLYISEVKPSNGIITGSSTRDAIRKKTAGIVKRERKCVRDSSWLNYPCLTFFVKCVAAYAVCLQCARATLYDQKVRRE